MVEFRRSREVGGRRKTVLCNSEQTREEVSRFFGHDGTVVWLPLQIRIFRLQDPLECRRRLGLSDDTAWGLFVGSTDPAKGFGTVRQLIEALPDVHWILVIRGQAPPDLVGVSRVRIYCDLPEEDLPSIYAAADFLICPSYYESFGYVVAESLACGTPVVASAGGASRAFLCDAPLNRVLIPDPRCVDQFVKAVRAILSIASSTGAQSWSTPAPDWSRCWRGKTGGSDSPRSLGYDQRPKTLDPVSLFGPRFFTPTH